MTNHKKGEGKKSLPEKSNKLEMIYFNTYDLNYTSDRWNDRREYHITEYNINVLVNTVEKLVERVNELAKGKS